MSDLFSEADGRVRPVCLPTTRCSGGGEDRAACFAGQRGSVAGWGITNPVLQSSPGALLEVQLPILDNTACRASYHQIFRITDSMLCAGVQQGGRDTCQVRTCHVHQERRDARGTTSEPLNGVGGMYHNPYANAQSVRDGMPPSQM